MIRDSSDLGFGAVKNGQDQPGLGGFHRTGQRVGAARMHHAGQHRLQRPAALDQSFEPMLRQLDLLPCRGCQDFQHCRGNDVTCWIGALAVQHDDPLIRALLAHDKPRRHHCVDRQAALDLHRGGADRTAGPRQGRTDQGGQDGSDDASSHLAFARAAERAHFTECGRPGANVACLQPALGRRGVAGSQVFECLVNDGPHGDTCLMPRRDSRHRRRRCFR